jgi:hypothetical protein
MYYIILILRILYYQIFGVDQMKIDLFCQEHN